jgi:hypothetical protein
VAHHSICGPVTESKNLREHSATSLRWNCTTLSSGLPDRIFMTVPRSFRRSSRTPAAVLLYKGELGVNEVVEIHGLPVTSLKRTLADVAGASLLHPDQLRTILLQQLATGSLDAQFVSALLGDQFQFRF